MRELRSAATKSVAAVITIVVVILATVLPAAAQEYPGLEPGVVIFRVTPAEPGALVEPPTGGEQRTASFAASNDADPRPATYQVRVNEPADFLASCGGGPLGVQLSLTETGVFVGGAYLVSDLASLEAWQAYAEAALQSHTPALSRFARMTISTGAGCNSYQRSVTSPPFSQAVFLIDTDFNMDLRNTEEFGCGYPIRLPEDVVIGVTNMRVFDLDGREIGVSTDLQNASDVDPWLDQLGTQVANHVPAIAPQSPIYMVWDGLCDPIFRSQYVYVGGLPDPESYNPESGATGLDPVRVLAGLSLATAVAVGVRRQRLATTPR